MGFVGKDSVYIIAEAGDNHNGNIEMAHELVDLAKKANADAVKFQTFCTDLVTHPSAIQANYQMQNTGTEVSQMDMIRALEMPQSAFAELKKHADQIGIDFISTPFDAVSAKTLAELKMRCMKVSSGDLVNYPLLKQIASFKMPVILSSGMAELDEIDFGVQALKRHGVKQIGLLHCVSNYPAAAADCNMRAIQTLAARYPDVVIGWSDHTLGNTTAIMAVSYGARIIEKHYTLDKNLPGPDHAASASSEEIIDYVRAIREAEAALGDGKKRIMPSEANTAEVAKRSLFAGRDIKAGEKVQFEDLVPLRPGGGISPRYAEDVAGTTAKQDIAKNELFDWNKLEKAKNKKTGS